MRPLLRSCYARLPFKREFFHALRAVARPGKNVYKHLHFQGLIRIPVPGHGSFRIMHYGHQIENELFWEGLTGGWEKESMKWWIRLCRDAQVIFDIGANTGVYALTAQTVNPAARVYAFEPVQRVFDKLQRNVQINQYPIRCFSQAISDQDGHAVIYDNRSEHLLSVTVNRNFFPEDMPVEEVRIETRRLDTVVKQENTGHVDLIKLDVETHEPEAVKGFGDLTGKFKPSWLIEILNDDIGQRVEEILKEQGSPYLFFNIDERRGIRRVDHITQSDYYNYLLCTDEKARALGLI